MELPFELTIYNRDRERIEFITNPTSVSMTLRYLGQSAGSVGISDNDEKLYSLLDPGARYTLAYKGELLSSGRVKNPRGSLRSGTIVTCSLQDDWKVLSSVLAYIRPGGAVRPTSLVATDPATLGQAWLPGGASSAGQNGTTAGQTGYYLWPDGSAASGGIYVETAESAIKVIADQNFGRVGLNIAVAEDLRRGGDARGNGILPVVRNSFLDEVIVPIADWAGLGVKVWQPAESNDMFLDVWEPRVWEEALTLESGNVVDGDWSLSDPTATRALIGGPGEDAGRAFFDYIANDGREALYGDVLEVFKDATSATLKWPDTLADAFQTAKYYLLRPEVSDVDKSALLSAMATSWQKAQDEGAPKSGVSVELAETEDFSFWGADGFHMGDVVTVSKGDLTFTDRIRECTVSIASSDSEGVKVTPSVGAKEENPDKKLASAIRRVAIAQRMMSASR